MEKLNRGSVPLVVRDRGQTGMSNLLGALMPNGKALRNCTAKEVKGFGLAFGKLGERVGKRSPGELTNEELEAHYGGYTGYSLLASMRAIKLADQYETD
jgi:hypothetical protein